MDPTAGAACGVGAAVGTVSSLVSNLSCFLNGSCSGGEYACRAAVDALGGCLHSAITVFLSSKGLRYRTSNCIGTIADKAISSAGYGLCNALFGKCSPENILEQIACDVLGAVASGLTSCGSGWFTKDVIDSSLLSGVGGIIGATGCQSVVVLAK